MGASPGTTTGQGPDQRGLERALEASTPQLVRPPFAGLHVPSLDEFFAAGP